MRWVEFLIHFLTAQGQTLQRLAALFGEEDLLEMLEEVGESYEVKPLILDLNPERFQSAGDASGSGNPYQQLEWAVTELKLSPTLEFHLWAYPFYRYMIESGVELDARVGPFPDDFTHVLVNEAVKQAKDWVQRLPIAPEHSLQAEKAALVSWLRFRSEVLKRFGQSPMVPI